MKRKIYGTGKSRAFPKNKEAYTYEAQAEQLVTNGIASYAPIKEEEKKTVKKTKDK